eukprot:10245319-Ditylum_brightwellii.AAC.1
MLGPYKPPVEQKALMLRQSSSSLGGADMDSNSKNKQEDKQQITPSLEFTRGERGLAQTGEKNQKPSATRQSTTSRRKQTYSSYTTKILNQKDNISSFSSQEMPPPATEQIEASSPPTILPHPSQQIGDLDIEMAFVPDVLEPIISASKLIAEERSINFQIIGMNDENEELPGVSLCPKSLQEAVANILDNAFKYVTIGRDGRKMDGNSNPQIRVVFTPNDKPLKPGVTIYVEDNGPGIPPSEREAVFQRGYRGDATRLLSGSGIGLDISRTLLSRMNGILDVMENEEGHLNGT